VCLARVLALLAVLVEVCVVLLLLLVMKLASDFVGDVGSEGGGVCTPENGGFVAREIRGGSLHLSKKACVMLCL
jgi:hypothetical protein